MTLAQQQQLVLGWAAGPIRLSLFFWPIGFVTASYQAIWRRSRAWSYS